jgi:hypothetical protein
MTARVLYEAPYLARVSNTLRRRQSERKPSRPWRSPRLVINPEDIAPWWTVYEKQGCWMRLRYLAVAADRGEEDEVLLAALAAAERRRCHSHAALYILYGEPLSKHTEGRGGAGERLECPWLPGSCQRSRSQARAAPPTSHRRRRRPAPRDGGRGRASAAAAP